MRLPKLVFATLFLFLACTASADTLEDIRSVLSRLPGKQAIHATYSMERTSATSGRFGDNRGSHQVAVDVARTGDGVSVTVPLALLERAAEEARMHSGSFKNETRNAISSISPMSIADDLNYAPSLSGILQMGRVSDERREIQGGRSLRRLILDIKQPMTKSEGVEIGEVKTTEDRMTLWIGEDNIPVSAHRSRKMRAGFLFLHGDTSEEFNWTFARSGDSLVLVRFEQLTAFSGMGQKGNGKTVSTISIK